MFDNLYSNIGTKIKVWAKMIFVIEAASAIGVGVTQMVENEFLHGALWIVIGFIVAYISTWLLYAFGEITEDIGLMRQKYVGDKVIEPQKKEPITTHQTHQTRQTREPTPEEIRLTKQAEIRKKWDHWNEEDSSIGRCDVCGTKGQFLVYAEYQEGDSIQQKNLCFECFSHRECRPVTRK